MKKYRNILIILTTLLLVPVVFKIIKTHHEVEYEVNGYKIKEIYRYNKKHSYDFIIKKGKQEYSYTINKNMNKNKKIIKEIKSYKENNVICIKPTYIKDNDNELYCLEDNKQVSTFYLKDNDSYKKIIKKLKINNSVKKSKIKEYKKIEISKDNIPENYKVIVWNYKGIYIISNDNIINQKFIDYDLYDNIMKTTTSKYYVLFENTKVSGIKKVHYYDLKKDKYKTLELKKTISKKSYINGVVDDLIYITDIDKMKQYTLDLDREELEEVGNQNLGFIKYINGEKQILKRGEFFNKNQYFENERIEEKKVTSSRDLIFKDNYYYFKKNNKIYSRLINSTDKILFELDDIKEWNIIDDDIILISNDSLYMYHNNELKNILKYNELNYNYKDICTIWKY